MEDSFSNINENDRKVQARKLRSGGVMRKRKNSDSASLTREKNGNWSTETIVASKKSGAGEQKERGAISKRRQQGAAC